MTKPEFTTALTRLQSQAHAIEEALYRLRYPEGIEGDNAPSLRRLLANGDHGNPLAYSVGETIEAAQRLMQSICHQLAATAECHGCRLPIVDPVHQRVRQIDCGGDAAEHIGVLDKAPAAADGWHSYTVPPTADLADDLDAVDALDRELAHAAEAPSGDADLLW